MIVFLKNGNHLLRKKILSPSVASIPAIYIHIPFCKKICPFCSFAVLRDNPSNHLHYLELLKDEFLLLCDEFSFDFSKLKSVYIGGGTPSRLSEAEMHVLVDWICSFAKCSCKVQWSIEVNPEDICDNYLQKLKTFGFNRLSLGVQSFQSVNLETLGRVHSSYQSRFSVEATIKAGFKDFNIDLIFGFPGQSMELLNKDLEAVLRYNPTHVSVYSLSIEPKTVLNRKPEWKNWVEANEKLISEMYSVIIETLTGYGLVHYEVSNFCIEGFQSKQNMVYWNRRNYLGLGLGAHSFASPYRWGNEKRLVDYKKSLRNNTCPYQTFEKLNETMHRDEELMLSLRLNQGLNLKEFKLNYQLDYPESWDEKINLYYQHRLLKFKGDYLCLTTKGLLIADEITSSLCSTLP